MIEINPLGAMLGLSFLAFIIAFAGYVIYDDWRLHHPKKKLTTKHTKKS